MARLRISSSASLYPGSREDFARLLVKTAHMLLDMMES